MTKNAIITTNLESLLDVMDARTTIKVFFDGSDDSLATLKVYNLLSEPGLMARYGKYRVVGLSVTLGITNILIKEA